MLTTALHTVVLAGDTDLDGFRRAARGLIAADMPPDAVVWHTGESAAGDLFGHDDAAAPPHATASAARPHVPADFLRLCETVVLHADPGRFALQYRLLWRHQHEASLRNDPLDADRVLAEHMAQAVRRDLHKMKAFVRFTRIDAPEGSGAEPLHVAWFEPSHHIVEAVAPFFMRRFTAMRWAILTPERCVRWDGHQLEFSPGARREDAPPPDAGEALWLTYYQHIFNPARLKLQMMQKEMPRKYWHNLPEAALISELSAKAAPRSAAMVEQAATLPTRRIPIAAANPTTTMHTTSHLTLANFKHITDRCRECPIGEHATQSVCGEGPAKAKLMVVGEQPGDREDLQGRPFVGPAGQLFDRAMQDIGASRDAVFVTNAVKHFKFELRGKRRIHKTPAQREAAACLHWLEGEIDLVQPAAFMALGATAARALMGRAVAVTKERGEWLAREDGRPVLVTLHPSALLRMQAEERDAAYAMWLDDLRKAVAGP
jgi:probable DNA metabolism protein